MKFLACRWCEFRCLHPEWVVILVCAAAWIAIFLSPESRFTGMLMIPAMMLPLAVRGSRLIAFASLWPMRSLNVVSYLAAFLAVWLVAAGVLMTASMYLRNSVRSLTFMLIVIATALGWDFSVFRRRALRRCERSPLLAPRGLRAIGDAAQYGARNATNCAISCWAIMAFATTFARTPLIMLCLATYEWARSIEHVRAFPKALLTAAIGGRLLG
jgi:hypothetical protein